MTFSELWQNYCIKKPVLVDPEAKVQMTSAQFHDALQLAFEAGQAEARGADMFDSLFGRGK
jgi:hypothetical protein